jgi:hypothetical protein
MLSTIILLILVFYSPIKTPLGIDNYELPPETYIENYASKDSVDSVISFAQMWLKDSDEVLIYSFYTDFFIEKVVHIDLETIDDLMLKEISLYRLERNVNKPADIKTVREYFPKFLRKAKPLPPNLKSTIRGLRLGDDILKTKRLYGEPQNREEMNGFMIYTWELPYDQKVEYFGQKISIFFQNAKVVSIIIGNEPP